MNSLQVVDVVTCRIKKFIWIAWYEAIMLEMIVFVLVATFVLLGAS